MRLSTILGSVLLAAAFTVRAHASFITVVPEIDPATLSGGIALLAGGTLFLLSRMRRK